MIHPPELRRAEVVASARSTNQGPATARIGSEHEIILRRLIGQIPHVFGQADRIRLERRMARELIRRIGGHCWDGKNDMLVRVHRAIVAHNPATRITFRRVRSFWHKEAQAIGFCEMVELATVAALSEAGHDQ